jgi:hypothetical protein
MWTVQAKPAELNLTKPNTTSNEQAYHKIRNSPRIGGEVYSLTVYRKTCIIFGKTPSSHKTS